MTAITDHRISTLGSISLCTNGIIIKDTLMFSVEEGTHKNHEATLCPADPEGAAGRLQKPNGSALPSPGT